MKKKRVGGGGVILVILKKIGEKSTDNYDFSPEGTKLKEMVKLKNLVWKGKKNKVS